VFPKNRQQNSFGRKRAKQCGAVRLQGIGSFCMGGGKGASGQNNSSPGFARFAGQRPGARRSISADSRLVTLRLQSNSPPAATERANVVASTK